MPRQPATSKQQFLPKSRHVHMAPGPSPSNIPLFGSIAQGFGFGVGSSVGHKAVDAVFAPAPAPAVATPSAPMPSSDCEVFYKTYQDCMNSMFHEQNCDVLFDHYLRCIESKTRIDP